MSGGSVTVGVSRGGSVSSVPSSVCKCYGFFLYRDRSVVVFFVSIELIV